MKRRTTREGGKEGEGLERAEILDCITKDGERERAKVDAVQRMQDEIRRHAAKTEFTAGDVYAVSGYSPRHAERLFRELTGRSVGDYLRAARLSSSSERLISSKDPVIQIALDAGFESHEGFSRAFFQSYRISPRSYRRDPVPIPLLIQYPVRAYLTLLQHQEETKMEQQETKKTRICTVTAVSRPKRKLMLLRSEKATDYWSFCEEKGCGWTGLLNSIPEKLDLSGLVELPKHLVKPGTSAVGAGVELPGDYDAKKVPQGYELLELEPCEMLVFQTEPYEDEQAFCEAIDAAQEAAGRYDPKAYGFEYAFDAAPKFNYGADTWMGAKIAVPVRRV